MGNYCDCISIVGKSRASNVFCFEQVYIFRGRRTCLEKACQTRIENGTKRKQKIGKIKRINGDVTLWFVFVCPSSQRKEFKQVSFHLFPLSVLKHFAEVGLNCCHVVNLRMSASWSVLPEQPNRLIFSGWAYHR